MKKYNWRLPLLQEFEPQAANLLGINHDHGQKIQIRLRYSPSNSTFRPFQQLLGTLLHELAHNVHGPHNADFYKLLSQLEDDLNQLQIQGYQGDGFFGKGQKVSHVLRQPVSMAESRRKAADSAEKRRQISNIMIPAGGKRLGQGDLLLDKSLEKDLPPSQMAAMMAENRVKDNLWCGETHKDNVQEIKNTANSIYTTPVQS